MSLVAIAAGALSGVLFALKDVFSKRAIEKNGLENALFYMYFALWSPFAIYLFLFSGFQGYTAEAWNTGLFVGGGLALGYFFFFKLGFTEPYCWKYALVRVDYYARHSHHTRSWLSRILQKLTGGAKDWNP